MSKIKTRSFVKFVSAFCAFGFVVSSSAFADTLATWVVPTSTAAVGQTISGSTTFGGMITVNTVNFTGTFVSSSSGWGGSGFARETTLGASVSKNFNFSITANTGNQIVVTEVANIQMTQTSTGTGPDVYTVYYSLNNWATSTEVVSVTGCRAVTKDLATPINDYLKMNSGANAITVKSGKTLSFRIVGTSNGGTSGTSGTGRLLKDATFTLIGTVSVAPIANLVWGGGATGAWDYDVNNLAWLDGSTSVAFSSEALATISSASSITVAASGVTAAVLTNSIASGVSTISGGVLDVPILVKTGAGTLKISNILTNITTVQLNDGTLALQGGGTNNLGGGTNITGMPNLTMADGTTLDLGDTDQNVANFNGAGTVVMTNINSSGTPANNFKVTCTIPSSFSGSITGVGTFRLCGGVFTNQGNNTYTGGTWISNGATMYIAAESALPRQTKDDPLTTTSGPGTAVDLRISSGGATFSAFNPGQLKLNRSIGDTAGDGQIRIQAAAFSDASLELAGPIYTERSIYITNPSSSAGTVILSGSNTFQITTTTDSTSGIITTNIPELRLAVNGRLLFNSQQSINGALVKATDPTSSLGLSADVVDEVAATNSLVISSSADIANFNIGLGVSGQTLRWNGPISGPGSLYLTNKGTLIFGTSNTNSYQGGTLLQQAGILLVSAQNQLPSTTNLVARGGDVRFSTGGGTFGLDNSLGSTNLVLTNSFYFASSGGLIAGTNTNNISTLTLAGPFNGTSSSVGAEITGPTNSVGKLILTGNNTNFAGALRVSSRGRVYILGQSNLPAQISFSDTTGYARFGLAEASPDDVTITNAISTGVSNTLITATFNPGTNVSAGTDKRLNLSGVISGPGRVRVADGGALCLNNSNNTYTNLTRIGTGRILFGSNGALGSTNTNSVVPGAYGGIRFETISDSYLVATNDVTLAAGRTIFIENTNTANLDSQSNIFTVAGVVQDEVLGEPGSVNKLGSGEVILSGALSYSGNTTVSAGKLTLSQINAANSASAITIVTGAVLNLDFSGSQTVDKLYLDGVQSVAGTYNSSNSSGAITGAGSLVVTSSPVIANTAPVITPAQAFSVAENAALATVVGTVVATDVDANSTLSGWTIVSGNTGSVFAINAATGQITVAGALNYEATPSYSLGVTVSDGTTTSEVGTVVVSVTNVAEYSDVFGSSSPTADDNGDGISNLMAYALGAASPSSVVLPPALNTADPTKLTITAVVRINDPKLSVVGEYGLTPGTWVTGSPISGVDSSIQTGAVDGVSKKKDFSVDRGTDAKKFMHLKATQAP